MCFIIFLHDLSKMLSLAKKEKQCQRCHSTDLLQLFIGTDSSSTVIANSWSHFTESTCLYQGLVRQNCPMAQEDTNHSLFILMKGLYLVLRVCGVYTYNMYFLYIIFFAIILEHCFNSADFINLVQRFCVCASHPDGISFNGLPMSYLSSDL